MSKRDRRFSENQFQGIVHANNPTSVNPFATMADLGGGGEGDFLPLIGGTMTGNILMKGDTNRKIVFFEGSGILDNYASLEAGPMDAPVAITMPSQSGKLLVEANLGAYLQLWGGTMLGSILFGVPEHSIGTSGLGAMEIKAETAGRGFVLSLPNSASIVADDNKMLYSSGTNTSIGLYINPSTSATIQVKSGNAGAGTIAFAQTANQTWTMPDATGTVAVSSVSGFTGTGAYTNFTIENGVITAAS